MKHRPDDGIGRREALTRLSAGAGGAALAPAAGGLALGGGLATAGAACAQTGGETAPRDPGHRLREMLSGDSPVLCPGAFDVLSARLIVEMGFEAVLYGGSAGSAANFGLPDYGLASITELTEVAARIAGSVPVPVFADADDGGGSPLAVARAVRGYERGGLAAVMIEDHVQAKHLGEGGVLIETPRMQDRVRAAADARSGGLMLVARCDAVSVGLDESEAMDRGAAYAEAGADLLFFAGLAPERIGAVSEAAGRPVIASVHDTPLSTLRENRVPLVLYASQMLRLALGAMRRGLEHLREGAADADGPTWPGYADQVLPGEDYTTLIESDCWRADARRYNLVDETGRQIRG